MNENRSFALGYKIAIGVLTALLAVLLWFFINQRKEISLLNKGNDTHKSELKEQLDSLLAEHQRVKISYGELTNSLSAKDSLINLKAREIKGLLETKSELAVVKQKLSQLQQITHGYEKQMDSLYFINKQLVAENDKIKSDFSLEKQKTRDLTKIKEELDKKISTASVLKAYKIVATALKTKGLPTERETDRANRTDKIKVCFLIGENKLITSGPKNFYIRIARPDNLILTPGTSSTFRFLGELLQYSTRETVNYMGDEVDVCTNYEITNPADLPKGRYYVNIFTEDREIGQTTFELK